MSKPNHFSKNPVQPINSHVYIHIFIHYLVVEVDRNLIRGGELLDVYKVITMDMKWEFEWGDTWKEIGLIDKAKKERERRHWKMFVVMEKGWMVGGNEGKSECDIDLKALCSLS